MQSEGLSGMESRKFVFRFHVHAKRDQCTNYGQVGHDGGCFSLFLFVHTAVTILNPKDLIKKET